MALVSCLRPGERRPQLPRDRSLASSLTQGHHKIVNHMRKLGYRVGLRKVCGIRRPEGVQLVRARPGVRRRGLATGLHQGEATQPDQVSPCDFVMLSTMNGRAPRVVFTMDECNKRIVARFIATAIKQEDGVCVLPEAMIR